MKKISLVLLLPCLCCKTSEKLLVAQGIEKNAQERIQIKEKVIEPMISFVEIPIDCPEDSLKPSTYQVKTGASTLKAQIHGKSLKLTAQSEGSVSRDSIKEKILTADRYLYRDKIKTVRIPYTPKWAWALLAFNLLYFGWRHRKSLLSLWVR